MSNVDTHNPKPLGNTVLLTAVRPLSSGNQSLLKNTKPLAELSKTLTAILIIYTESEKDQLKTSLGVNTAFQVFKKKKNAQPTAATNSKKRKNVPAFHEKTKILNEDSTWTKSIPALSLIILRMFFLSIRLALKNTKIDTIIAYETTGIVSANILKIFNRKAGIIAVYQGTALGSLINKNNNLNKIKACLSYPIDLLSWLLKKDLILITNDGTHGIEVSKVFGYSHTKTLSIPNSVHQLASNYSPATTKRIERQIFGICCMRATSWKRLDRIPYLLNYLKDFCAEQYEALTITVVGDGPTLHYVKNLATQLDVSHKIRFEGALPYEDTLSMIKKSDFILATSDVSNLSNSVLDGLALGKTVFSIDEKSLNELAPYLTQKDAVNSIPPSASAKEIAEYFSGFLSALPKDDRKPLYNLTPHKRDQLIKEWIFNNYTLHTNQC